MTGELAVSPTGHFSGKVSPLTGSAQGTLVGRSLGARVKIAMESSASGSYKPLLLGCYCIDCTSEMMEWIPLMFGCK